MLPTTHTQRLRPTFCEGVPGLFRLPTPAGAIAIRPGQPGRDHPVIGPTDAICSGDFEPLTEVGRIDWLCPDRVPPVLAPARLPPGAGTGLLNVIAENAPGPLRYRGPYPTAALFESLLTCFHTAATVEAFTAGVEEAAVAGRVLEPDVWFEPAPFSRYRSGRVVVETRGEPPEIQAIYVDGARFDRRARVGRRVVPRSDGQSVAVFEVPGNAGVELVSAAVSGEVTSPVAPLSPPAGSHLGKPLPGPVAAAIFAAARSAAPELLAPGIDAIRERGVLWADTGLALAAVRDGRLAVHGAMALGDLEPAELMVALIEAAVPVALRLAQTQLGESEA